MRRIGSKTQATLERWSRNATSSKFPTPNFRSPSGCLWKKNSFCGVILILLLFILSLSYCIVTKVKKAGRGKFSQKGAREECRDAAETRRIRRTKPRRAYTIQHGSGRRWRAARRVPGRCASACLCPLPPTHSPLSSILPRSHPQSPPPPGHRPRPTAIPSHPFPHSRLLAGCCEQTPSQHRVLHSIPPLLHTQTTGNKQLPLPVNFSAPQSPIRGSRRRGPRAAAIGTRVALDPSAAGIAEKKPIGIGLEWSGVAGGGREGGHGAAVPDAP